MRTAEPSTYDAFRVVLGKLVERGSISLNDAVSAGPSNKPPAKDMVAVVRSLIAEGWLDMKNDVVYIGPLGSAGALWSLAPQREVHAGRAALVQLQQLSNVGVPTRAISRA